MVHNFHSTSINDKSFLITGGAGFIGSNLVEYLLEHGAKLVRVLDNFSTGRRENIDKFSCIPRFELIIGDIRDLDVCRACCRDIDFVSHQAALGSVPRSINDPLTTNEVNVTGFLNMLIAVRDEKVKRMVYAASSSTYGDSKELPKIEDRIGKPLSPYAVTKYVNELYADVFAKTYGVQTVGLRYFNIFGRKQNPEGAYAAVIPLFANAILAGKAARINGDGEQTRDFTYIDNAIQANVLAMLSSDNAAVNQVYNIAGAQRISLNELWELLNGIAGTSIDAEYGPARAGDVRDSLADITKARTLLSYEPVCSVKEGLLEVFNWYAANLKRH